MYWRSFIREGDTTTPAGGKVQPVPQQWPVTYDGKHGCFEGDPVYCNACKSWGVTKCVPPYHPHTAPDGRQANLDGDLCICKCPTPPRLKALFDNSRMGFDGHEIARMAGAMQWLAYAGHESGEHEIFFEIIDATTNQPINGMAYKLVNENGVVAESQKLTNGKTSSFSLKEHPNLTFIAWHDGDVR